MQWKTNVFKIPSESVNFNEVVMFSHQCCQNCGLISNVSVVWFPGSES